MSHKHDHVPHGTLKGYLAGFLLSVVLTAIPFWLVMGQPLQGVFSNSIPLALLLLAFAVVQMLVHMVFFLHMSPRAEGGWSFMALAFTLVLVVIVMSGSMWVMFHLNANMMPTHDMSSMDTTGEAFIPPEAAVSATLVAPAPKRE